MRSLLTIAFVLLALGGSTTTHAQGGDDIFTDFFLGSSSGKKPTGDLKYQNYGSNGTVALKARMFNKVFQSVIPILDSVGPTIEIDKISGDSFESEKFNLEQLSVQDINVAFKPETDATTLAVTIDGLQVKTGDVTFKVFKTILGARIECTGTVNAQMRISSAELDVTLSKNETNDRLAGVAAVPSVDISTINIEHTMNTVACKVSGSVITLAVDTLKSTIKSKAQSALRTTLANTLNSLMNASLPNAPLLLTQDGEPSLKGNTIQMSAVLVPAFKSPIPTPSGTTPTIATAHIFEDRDVSVGITTESFNNLLNSMSIRGGFFIDKVFAASTANTSIFKSTIKGAYTMCPDCPIGMIFYPQPSKPPTIGFSSTGGVNQISWTFTDAVANISCVDPAGVRKKMFDFQVSLVLDINDFTVGPDPTVSDVTTLINFNVSLMNGMTLKTIENYQSDTTFWFSTLAGFAINTWVLPAFNANFSGVPLTVESNGFGLANWTLDMTPAAVSLGADFVVPSATAAPYAAITPAPILPKKKNIPYIIAGVVAAVIVVIALCACCNYRRHKQGLTHNADDPMTNERLGDEINSGGYGNNNNNNVSGAYQQQSSNGGGYGYGQV